MVLQVVTPRLGLTPLGPGERDPFHALCVSPGVRRYLFDDEVLTRDRTAELVQESGRLQRDEGTGLWGARFHGASDLVGFCGFWYFRDPPELELLFALGEPHWGRGLATEMAVAMVQHGFDALEYARIVASSDAANSASVRVMEKAGMRFVRRATVGGLDTVFYAAQR